jgi:hypothetical protein
MDTSHHFIAMAMWLSACIGQAHAAQFMNFDFEAASGTLPPETSAGPVPTEQAFPGWQAYVGSSPQPVVAYNTFFLASPNIALVGPEAGFASPIEGTFSALLQPGLLPGNSLPVSLAQIGEVPMYFPYLQMRVYLPTPNDTFEVTLGGQPISMVPSMISPNSTLFIGDVSAFWGQTTELRITALPPAEPGIGGVFFDSINFAVVPEPSTGALLFLGTILVGIGWRMKRKNAK